MVVQAVPDEDYVPIRSVQELERVLQTGSEEPLYLQLGAQQVFEMLNGMPLERDTTADIKCGDVTIKISQSEEIELGTHLTFRGCKVIVDSMDPLASVVAYDTSTVFGPCEDAAEDSDNPFALLTDREFNTEFTQQAGESKVMWDHSNFTCASENGGEQEPAAGTADGFLDKVKSQWPYVALAGGVLLLLIVALAIVMLRRSRLRPQKVQAQRESDAEPATGPKAPPDASVAIPRHRWSETPSQGNTPASQRGSMPRASASQMLFVEDSGTRAVRSGSVNPVSPGLSEGPPATPGTPQGTSISSFNSDLPIAIQNTMAQVKRDLPDVPLDILQHIGSGGYGNVYRGSWKGLEVAIKTIVFQDRHEDGTAERVIKEAAIACNMSNEHVVNTFAHELKRMPVQVPGELVDYKLYIIQEFCVGGSLAKLLTGEHLMTATGGVQVHRVLTVLRHVASGMAYMHKLRMVHGDLNPSNIFLQLTDNKYVQTPRRRKRGWKPLTREAARGLDDGNCVVKLGDFGLTVQLQHGCTHVSNITHGTPFYSAPELATQGRLQCESDVYSFGVLMWEMYHNDTPYDMKDDSYIPNPQFGRFSLSTPLNYALLVMSCLSAQPEDRPSFVQVIEFLAAICLELASGYYTNMVGSTEPASAIAQNPITEMMDYVPQHLLQARSKASTSSTKSLQHKMMSQGSSEQPQGKVWNPRTPAQQGACSHSWHSRSVGISDGRASERSTKGSPRPAGERAEV